MGTVTVLWMEAMEEPMAKEWRGRKERKKGEDDLLFATEHL